jgi:hypothetical protein
MKYSHARSGSKPLAATLLLLSILLWPISSLADVGLERGTVASKVRFTILDCSASLHGVKPQVRVRDISTGMGRGWVIAPESTTSADSRTIVTFRITSGSYTVVVTQGRCGDIFDMTVRSGFDRNLAVKLGDGIFMDYHDHNSLTGILPFPGLSADLLICVSASCDLSTLSGFNAVAMNIDGGAYYVNQLPATDWYLRLHFSDTCSLLVPVDGSNVPGMKYGHLQRDITDADLMKAEANPVTRKC